MRRGDRVHLVLQDRRRVKGVPVGPQRDFRVQARRVQRLDHGLDVELDLLCVCRSFASAHLADDDGVVFGRFQDERKARKVAVWPWNQLVKQSKRTEHLQYKVEDREALEWGTVVNLLVVFVVICSSLTRSLL